MLTVNGDLGCEGRVRVMHVQHTQGPLDGSVYAQVKAPRARYGETSRETTLTNGVCCSRAACLYYMRRHFIGRNTTLGYLCIIII